MSKNKEFTISEVAKKFGVSERTILREIKRGKLLSHKVGRRYLISAQALEVYVSGVSQEIGDKIHEFCQSKKQEMITLLQKLVSMPSESHETDDCEYLAKYLKKRLEAFGIRSVVYGRDDGVVVRGTFGFKDKGILLDCPLDTIPAGDLSKWKHPPFEGVIKKGKMYGRGTADSKAGIVAMIYAILALKEFVAEDQLRVELVFDAGEQTGAFNGMKTALEKGLPVKSGIIGYAGVGNNIGIGARGYHRFKFNSHGHSVHTGARFKAGINAITNMAALITEMEHVRFPRSNNKYFDYGSKLAFSMISGGRAINIVPDECEAFLDVRTTPEVKRKDVELVIKKIIKGLELKYKGFRVGFDYLVGHEGYILSEEEELVSFLKKVIKKTTGRKQGLVAYGPSHIGNLLYEHNIPVVVWGPKGENVHSYDEYVEIDSVPVAAEVYANAILHYFDLKSYNSLH